MPAQSHGQLRPVTCDAAGDTGTKTPPGEVYKVLRRRPPAAQIGLETTGCRISRRLSSSFGFIRLSFLLCSKPALPVFPLRLDPCRTTASDRTILLITAFRNEMTRGAIWVAADLEQCCEMDAAPGRDCRERSRIGSDALHRGRPVHNPAILRLLNPLLADDLFERLCALTTPRVFNPFDPLGNMNRN